MRFLFSLIIFAYIQEVYGQQQKVMPYYPSQTEVSQSYIRQQRLDSLLKTIPLNTRINANWQGDYFWYVKKLNGNCQEYEYADAAKRTKGKLFDQQRLADSITHARGKHTDPLKLNISKMFFNAYRSRVTFKTDSDWLQCDLKSYKTNKTTDTLFNFYDSNKPLQTRSYRWEEVAKDSVSPDKKSLAFIKGGNLFVKEISTGRETKITGDGGSVRRVFVVAG